MHQKFAWTNSAQHSYLYLFLVGLPICEGSDPSLCLAYCATFIFLVLFIFLLRQGMLRQKTVVVDKGKGKLVAVVEP